MSRLAIEMLTVEFRRRFKTCWDYVRTLDESEFLELRTNDYFTRLLEEIDFSDISEEDVLSLSFREVSSTPKAEAKGKADIHIDTISQPEKEISKPAEEEAQSFTAAIDDNDISMDVVEEDQNVPLEILNKDLVLESLNQVSQLPLVKETSELERDLDSAAEYYQLSNALLDDLKNMRLNFASLSRSEHYAIERIQQHEPDYNFYKLVTESVQLLGHYPGIGNKVTSTLKSLANEVGQELQAIDQGKLNYHEFETVYVIPTSLDIASLEELQIMLSEDIDLFMEQLDPQDRTIFLERSGYNNTEIKTLQEVGDQFDITRERIRQLEAVIYERLQKSLRVRQAQIKTLIEENLTYDLVDKMPRLQFIRDKHFFNFIGKLANLPEINKIANPDDISIKVDLLEEFFSFNGVEVAYHDLFKYLYEHEAIDQYCEGLGKLSLKEVVIENYLEKLVRLKRLVMLDNHNVMPRLLPKESAAAALLCNYPQGLSWKAIAEKVNELNISRTNLETERPDHGALGGNNVYLTGKGEYGNIKFIKLESIDFDRFFDEVFRVFDVKNEEVLHLSTIYDLFDKTIVSNYYVLRYIVRTFGEDYGFYFIGKSQIDNVSLNKDFETISQQDLIVQEMNMSGVGMSVDEIAQLLKSKSVGHASYYLEKLMSAGEVVRIDNRLYSTPMIAYQGVDLARILSALRELIDNADKPIDYSYFEYLLNEELDENYSMYLYASIARKYADEYGWHRRQTLFSNQEILFNSSSEIVTLACDPKDPIEKQLIDLKRELYITDERAKRVIYQSQVRRE